MLWGEKEYESLKNTGHGSKVGMCDIPKMATGWLTNNDCSEYPGSPTIPREAFSEVAIFVRCLKQGTASTTYTL